MTDASTLTLTGAGRPVYALDFSVRPVGLSSPPPVARWTAKANAFAMAWLEKFGVFPSVWAIAEACSVAQHETLCGDAWPGEYNWGALQLRKLTPGEKAVLASLKPDPRNVKDARAALAAAVTSNAIPDEPHGALHVDSSPGVGWYWVFFRKCADDVEGAGYFIHVLCEQRPAVRDVLQRALGAWSTELFDIADRMYATHYFEGFYVPTNLYKGPDGTMKTGAQMNVLDYARALGGIAPTICTTLQQANWTPHPGKFAFDLSSVMGVQSALTFLAGKKQRPDFDPKGVDNVLGTNTKAAITAFQRSVNLAPSGTPDATTLAALRQALDQLGGA